MSLNPVEFYHFSGTGNTFLVSRRIKKVMVDEGIDVNMNKIEDSSPEDFQGEKTLGLAFPVAVHTTYPFVWDFIEELPDGRGRETFLVTTLAGTRSGSERAVGKELKKKGYNLVGSTEITMPYNFYFGDEKPSGREEKKRKGLKEAEKYAERLVKGEEEWNLSRKLSDIISPLSKTDPVWWLFTSAYGFEIDEKRCSRCGLCEELCPIDNIVMEDYPEFKGDCKKCMRCISFCPEGAIESRKGNLKPYRGVDPSTLLD